MFEFFVCKEHPQKRSEEWIGLQYNNRDNNDNIDGPSADSLVSFCFPLRTEAHTTKRLSSPEEYCFVLTQSNGDRNHGFCRRVYIGEYPKKLPVVFCIVTTELWSLFFYKVLEVLERLIIQEKLLGSHLLNDLPSVSSPAQFIKSLLQRLKQETSKPGAVMRIPIPRHLERLRIEPLQKIVTLGQSCPDLKCKDDFIELQIPPLTGIGMKMSAVSLARLLWRIPVQCLMTLFASLLLERRIIMVSKNKDTLSAAVHAAAALIYPFEWTHRFYLPIMPETLRDYLQAPMPFLIGLPAELMDFRGLQMDEVTLIDLDLGTCSPKPGSENDDAYFLPMREQLQDSLHLAVKALRSPTEYEGNQRIADVVVEYMVRIFKNYRDFLTPDKETLKVKPRALGFGRHRPKPVEKKSRHPDDAFILGHGFVFNHENFVASHKKQTDRIFLNMFRESQMYEVFIQQRLEMASQKRYPIDDPFENRITLIRNHKSSKSGLVRQNWSRRYSIKKAGHGPEKKVLRHSHSHVGISISKKEKVRSREMKSRRRLVPEEILEIKNSLADENENNSIKAVVKKMAEECAKEDLASVEPGNYLNLSRATCQEKGIEDNSQHELGDGVYKISSRSISQDNKSEQDQLISFDDDDGDNEPQDELGGFPIVPIDVAPSMTSIELEQDFPLGVPVAGSHEDSVRGAAMESEYQLIKKSNLVSHEPSFHISAENCKNEKLHFSRSPGDLSSLENASQSTYLINEKIPAELRHDPATKLEKMVEDSLNSLSFKSSSKSLKLPPKPMNSGMQKRPHLERKLAFSYGPHDNDAN
eukprot:g3071.t1